MKKFILAIFILTSFGIYSQQKKAVEINNKPFQKIIINTKTKIITRKNRSTDSKNWVISKKPFIKDTLKTTKKTK